MSLKSLARTIYNHLPIRLKCFVEARYSMCRMQIGLGSYIDSSVHILGKRHIQIGSNTCISADSWLNVNNRATGKISIIIGDNCFIGKNNFFTSGDKIVIGSYSLTTLGCKFISSTHNSINPKIPYILSGTINNDTIKVGVNCFIGSGATILGNVCIGHGSIIGSEALVLHDIPPFSMVVGNPARVVRRYSFIKKEWLPLTEITEEDEKNMPDEYQYLSEMHSQYPKPNLPWIAASNRLGNL